MDKSKKTILLTIKSNKTCAGQIVKSVPKVKAKTILSPSFKDINALITLLIQLFNND